MRRRERRLGLFKTAPRETAIEHQMTGDGRSRFGEKFRFTLVPQ